MTWSFALSAARFKCTTSSRSESFSFSNSTSDWTSAPFAAEFFAAAPFGVPSAAIGEASGMSSSSRRCGLRRKLAGETIVGEPVAGRSGELKASTIATEVVPSADVVAVNSTGSVWASFSISSVEDVMVPRCSTLVGHLTPSLGLIGESTSWPCNACRGGVEEGGGGGT